MRRLVGAIAVAASLLAGACGGGNDDNGATEKRTLGVFAASSLTESFTELGRMFEASRRGVTVTFSFGASSALAQQVVDGAPGDVFASADEANMAKVVGAGEAEGSPVAFARNRLSIVVAAGNPEKIGGLADLAEPGLVVVLCAPEVPCGSLANAALAKAGLAGGVRPASLEQNVKAVVTKVSLGEADAGIAYETDVKAEGTAKVAGVAVEGASDPALQAVYVTAPLKSAATADLARQWVAYVRSAEARAVLARFGFLPA
jgi:molybdate transport system substrate-binding protein